jgi:hypothetical protein
MEDHVLAITDGSEMKMDTEVDVKGEENLENKKNNRKSKRDGESQIGGIPLR